MATKRYKGEAETFELLKSLWILLVRETHFLIIGAKCLKARSTGLAHTITLCYSTGVGGHLPGRPAVTVTPSLSIGETTGETQATVANKYHGLLDADVMRGLRGVVVVMLQSLFARQAESIPSV